MQAKEWHSAVNAAAVCEVFWAEPAGGAAIAGTPLLWRGRPTLALSYANATVARGLAAASAVAVVLSDGRSSGSAWRAVAVTGRPHLVEDDSGQLFTEELLSQELRKHPPSRALADSLLLQKEHWWFLPRLLVSVEPETVTTVAARAGGTIDGVLAVFDDSIQLTAVSVTEDLAVAALPGDRLPDPGPAVLLRHDFSDPDMERWSSWRASGHWNGRALEQTSPSGELTLPGPPSLLERMRRHYRLSRDCRRELATSERQGRDRA